ncbi:MAG TPA: ABC transporter permease [Clostridiaceae bacterium]|jgi:ABC-2 type transport system permease protein|nr:ABC transporter permease [Clostridiaceae bacterium]
MINYLKSERYRLTRKISLHITSIVACALIIVAGFVLYFFGKNEANFPYATSYFFYANVVNGGTLIFSIVLLVNSSLTGKDLSTLKQSLSFGISRSTIFWSKLILTFMYFLLLCFIGMILMGVLGETLFTGSEPYLKSFLLASVNMFPIVFSAFMLVHVMQMNRIGTVYTIIVILVIYTASDNIVNLMFRLVGPLDELYKWTPSALLNENAFAFMENTISFSWNSWLVGIGLSIIFLAIGLWQFNKKDID